MLEGENSAEPEFCEGFGRVYFEVGQWKEAEEPQLQVRNARLRVLGTEHPDTLSAMGTLAAIYRNQGRWKEAEELQLQVKDARFRVLGAEHPDTLQAIEDLAVMYSNTGQWEVEELFK